MAQDLSLVNGDGAADAALGLLGTDYYDLPIHRDALKALGFQANGQSCAYLPDSSLTTRDKINVRDGHYPLWGRIHFFTGRTNGTPSSPVAAAFLSLFIGPTLDPVILAAFIKAGWVPACAGRCRPLEAGMYDVHIEQRLPSEPAVLQLRLLRVGIGARDRPRRAGLIDRG